MFKIFMFTKILGHGQGLFDCVGGLFIDSMSNIFAVDRMNHSECFFLNFNELPFLFDLF
jgi:hypothetical protein